ncbi:hypothetical protein HK104_003558, partial [Borealophlyctis nickersoniae]
CHQRHHHHRTRNRSSTLFRPYTTTRQMSQLACLLRKGIFFMSISRIRVGGGMGCWVITG